MSDYDDDNYGGYRQDYDDEGGRGDEDYDEGGRGYGDYAGYDDDDEDIYDGLRADFGDDTYNDQDYSDVQLPEVDDIEYLPSYAQLEQISVGNTTFGTSSGGSRKDKLIQNQFISKEDLYKRKLASELGRYFQSNNMISNYLQDIEKVPKYWYKNVTVMAATINLLSELHNTMITKEKLQQVSEERNISKEDLFRYYRLLKKYIIFH